MEDTSSAFKKRRLQYYHLSMPSPYDLQRVLDQPVCSMLCILKLGLTHSPYVQVYLFVPEVQSHPDDSHMHVTAPCFARALSQAHPTMLCIHLVTYILHVLCVRVKWPAHDSSNTPVMDIWVFPVFTQGELALLNLVLEQIPWSAILQSMCKCNMSQLSIIYQGHD